MEKRVFKTISDSYYSFRENLNESNDNKITCHECYLIDENWFNGFECLLKENKKNKNSLMSIIPFPKNIPQILDTFQKAINFLEKNKKIYFINTNTIELMYSNNKNIDLKDKNTVQIYPRYNNVIIEFKKNESKENNENKIIDLKVKSLLLTNALNKDQTNIFIINVEKFGKINIFKKILNDFKINDDKGQNSIDKNCIIPLKEYFNDIINEKNIIKAHIKEDLLTFFIYIFYYEKSYMDNKFNYKNVLSDFQNYYLINYEWINQLKKYYNYDELYNLLKKDEENKGGFNFFNLRQKANDLLKKYINEKNFILKPLDIPKNLMNIDIIVSPKTWEKDIQIYKDCFIVNSEIMKIINKYIIFNKEIDFQTKKLSVNFTDLVLFDENNVVMYGNLNKLIFAIKYAIIFETSEIFNSEKKILSSTSFYQYLKKRKTEINNFDKQTLKNEEGQTIGHLEKSRNNKKELEINQNQFNFYKKNNEIKTSKDNNEQFFKSKEIPNRKEGDDKNAFSNKNNIEKSSEKNESKKEEKNLVENNKIERELNEINNLESLDEKDNESTLLASNLNMFKLKKSQLRDKINDFIIKKDELLEIGQIENKNKEKINKSFIKELYNYFGKNIKEINVKKNNNQLKKIFKKINYKQNNNNKRNVEKINRNNKINNVMNNIKNSKINFKVENIDNNIIYESGKEEEENMISKMKKSNNLNSLIEEYQTKFKKCKINILKIEEIIEAISNKLKEINYIGAFYMSFNELRQKIEEIKFLLNKDETNENDKGINYDKNLFQIQGIKLEEIENKNKALNKAAEDKLKNMINTLEKEKNEKDNKIKLLEKNIDEINNNYKAKIEEKEKELKEIKLLIEKIKENEEKIRAENSILQKEKEKLKINYEDKENKNNIYLAEKLKWIKHKENLIKKEKEEINLIKQQFKKCFKDIQKMQNI